MGELRAWNASKHRRGVMRWDTLQNGDRFSLFFYPIHTGLTSLELHQRLGDTLLQARVRSFRSGRTRNSRVVFGENADDCFLTRPLKDEQW